MEELKPCPFCGSNKAMKHKNVWKMYTVICEACGASIGNWYSKVQAENIWNGRSERTCRNASEQLFKCSSCGEYAVVDSFKTGLCMPNYCPNCGAKVVS